MNIEKKRAAIKAALLAATAGMTVSAAVNASAASHGAPTADKPMLVIGNVPWGEVIMGPVWEQKNPPPKPKVESSEVVQHEAAAQTNFWKW
jgi:hypothetical protein